MRLIILIFLSCTWLNSFAQPVKVHGALSVKGTQLVDASGKPYVLRGMSLGWSCFHPQYYTAGVVKELHKNWNSSVVRAALGIEPKKGYRDDPKGQRALIETVVDAAIKEGIYVIVDWHSHNINLAEAKEFFDYMAARYGKYENVIWEVFNEPDHETWPEVKAYSEAIIAVIRKHDPDNIILVGSPRWDQEVQLPAADPIKGQINLMYTMHFYAGTHKQWLRDRTDEAMKAGLPIFVSECAGMEATGNGPVDEEEFRKFIDWMDARYISYLTWSVSDKDETCSVLKAGAPVNGQWNDDHLKASGKLIKQILKGYAPVNK
ncbi:MAG: glycoside hydrolase family 5 protein [Chitinophagaceae bacterium]|jgi:endoglucanase|nr:glycoside hydrolase family 5 protein [Chitinophagaceae bacterium]